MSGLGEDRHVRIETEDKPRINGGPLGRRHRRFNPRTEWSSVLTLGYQSSSAMVAIRKEGGEILELTPAEHNAFATAVAPIDEEARVQYGRELTRLVNR